MGYSVTLLEGTDRIGGRLYTAPENEVPGHPEMGGSGIGGGYARLKDAASNFGVELEDSRPRTEPRDGELMYHLSGENILVDQWEGHAKNPFKDPAARAMPPYLYQYTAYGAAPPLPEGDIEAWRDPAYAKHDISVYDFLRARGVPDPATLRPVAAPGEGNVVDQGATSYFVSGDALVFSLQNAGVRCEQIIRQELDGH